MIFQKERDKTLQNDKNNFRIDSKSMQQIKETLYNICGINIADSKQTMMQNRINALIKMPECRNIESFDDLIRQVNINPQIKQSFINSFTTNKTDLFRESYHYSDMLDRSLVPLLSKNAPIKIFCSASSSGEEPYSIATTCLYAKGIFQSSSSIRITATDIDTQMLELARNGEYVFDSRLNKIPDWVELEKYFDVSRNTNGTLNLKAKSSIKSMVNFQQLNLFNKTYPFPNADFDIIFCRNVLIYFKQSDQEQILTRLHNLLKVGGTLYLGHSEDTLGLSQRFDRLGNKIFVRKGEENI